jgi:hypothetical protein
MKLYALSECYTPNEREAVGFISYIKLFKLKEDAVAKMKEEAYTDGNEVLYYKDNKHIHGESSLNSSGTLVGNAGAYDYLRSVLEWEIREYEIEV